MSYKVDIAANYLSQAYVIVVGMVVVPTYVRMTGTEAYGLIAAFRWVASLYRGIITGFQQLVWLSGFNALVTTFRFLLVIPVLQTIGATPIVFFSLMMSTRTVDTNLYQITKRAEAQCQ